jgi:ATP-dependent helicase HrpA
LRAASRKIEPEWLEQVGGHLIRKHVYEPHWEKGPGQVVAWERVTLHGLMIHAKRRVHYGPSDPQLAREILIREALVATARSARTGCASGASSSTTPN